MKKTAFLLIVILMLAVNAKGSESIEIQADEAHAVGLQLDVEADGLSDEKGREFLKKIAKLFNEHKSKINLSIKSAQKKNECTDDCSKAEKTKKVLTKVGRKLGKGAAWISTTTAKPFMATSGFVTGLIEKREKNQEIVALYQFFLNNQKEFDDLYLEAETPQELVELMLAKMEEIMNKKSEIIVKDFLAHIGIKNVPKDLSSFELSNEEMALIDMSKVDPAFINKHPEYQDVKPLIGEMTKEELMDIVMSGYFNKAISFENYKDALPEPYELVTTVVGQIFIPKMALSVISKSLAGLYATPVILADIGTGVSSAICLQKETQKKFKEDEDLKMFCGYVTNRSGYELMKSRAKGFVAGKKTRQKLSKKLKEFREKRAEKKRLKELQKASELH